MRNENYDQIGVSSAWKKSWITQADFQFPNCRLSIAY
jgi:hypothetical protein